MAEAAGSEPRYWKITVNPEECPKGAWAIWRAAGLAMLGHPGEAGETHYAVRNLKQLRVGEWLVAYTPQEGAFTVGGVGRVTRGYQCEEGSFDHPWNGPVCRSVGVEWAEGACRIDDLVKEGRFRKGKIARALDEITAAEFECVRERVVSAGTSDASREAATVVAQADAVPGTIPDEPPVVLSVSQIAETSALSAEEQTEADTGFDPRQAAREVTVVPRGGETLLAGGTSMTAMETAAAMHRSREAQLLSSFSTMDSGHDVLDFGLPTMGGDDSAKSDASVSAASRPGLTVQPFAVRVGSLGWSGTFRREVESGRPCSLLLRGPQYAFLNMASPGSALRGLQLFALFAIGAVAAPGKEALRSGATFVFRGRRAGGEYEIEVQPRHAPLVFREPAEAAI
jgi:hypothetical protein